MLKKLLFTSVLLLSLLCLTQAALAADCTIDYDGYSLTYSYAGQNASVSRISNVTGSGLTVAIPAAITVSGKNYNVTDIGNQSFRDVRGVTSVSCPGVRSIGRLSFYNCSGLVRIDCPNVTTIGYGAFKNCPSLTAVDGRSVKTIGEQAFLNCYSLNSINCPNVETTEKWAFYNCRGLTAVTFDKMTTVGNGAFEKCSGLQSISLADVRTIDECAFRDCAALTTLSCPNVESIGPFAFARCPELSEIVISDSNPNFCVDSDGLYETDGTTTTLRVFLNKSATVYQSNTGNIGEYAFYNCSLEKVCLPAAQKIDESSFRNDHALKTVIFGPNVNDICELAFENCTNLTAVYFTGWSLPAFNDSASSFRNVSIKNVFYCDMEDRYFDWGDLPGTKGVFGYTEIYENAVVCSVTFDRNGGSGIPLACLTAEGIDITIPEIDYTKENMYISGWTENADGTGQKYRTGDEFIVSGDTVLYAQWTVIPSEGPIEEPTEEPTEQPTEEPIEEPTEEPTEQPTEEPTVEPTPEEPTEEPERIYLLEEPDNERFTGGKAKIPIRMVNAEKVQGIDIRIENISGADISLNTSGSALSFEGDGSTSIHYHTGNLTGYTNPYEVLLCNIDISNAKAGSSVSFDIHYKVMAAYRNETKEYVYANPQHVTYYVPGQNTEISFDANGGTGDMNADIGMAGRITRLPVCPFTKEGYIFDHWSTSENDIGEKYYPGNRYVASEDTVFYAQWKKAVADGRIIYDFSNLTFDENMTNGNRSDSVPVYIQNADRIQGIEVQIENISNATVKFANADSLNGSADISDDGTHIIILNANGYSCTEQKRLFDVIITDAFNGSTVNFDLNFSVTSRGQNMTETYVKVNPDNVNVIVPGPVSCSVVYKDGIVGKADHIPKSEDVDPGTDYHVSDFRAIREGYVFTGWLDDNGEYVAPGDSLTITGNKELTAQWIPLEDGFTPRLRDVINLNQIILNHGNFVKNYDIDKNGRLNIFDLVYLSQYVADN